MTLVQEKFSHMTCTERREGIVNVQMKCFPETTNSLRIDTHSGQFSKPSQISCGEKNTRAYIVDIMNVIIINSYHNNGMTFPFLHRVIVGKLKQCYFTGVFSMLSNLWFTCTGSIQNVLNHISAVIQ